MTPIPEETLPGTLAALILLYGNTSAAQKRRPLDRDAIILGRSRGCDLALEAPDVSSIHCVISRSSGSYAVRDCGSRAGTRLNGDPIEESSLHDGDLLQIGPFSFRVSIPPTRQPTAGPAAQARQVRLERKRHNLVRLALAQRRRLQLLCTAASADNNSLAESELNRKASALCDRVREYEQRFLQLEQEERDLSRDQELFRQEYDAFQARTVTAEKELAQRKADLEAQISHRWQEFEQRCRQEEERRRQEAAEAALVTANEARAAAVDEEAERKLNIRRHELDFYARHLERVRYELREEEQKLADTHQHLMRGFLEMHIEQKENKLARDSWAREQTEASARLAQQRTAITQAEAALREQRAELVRMMGELKQLQEAVRSQQTAELQGLRQQNAELQQALAECERQHTEVQALQQENEQLRQAQAALPGQAPEVDPELLNKMDKMRGENELLRQLLHEKDALLEELRQRPQAEVAPPEKIDINSYEVELNQFRRQLETDREKLNAEVQQLRIRNQELDEATREMEMEMSRERADLARERTRLDRLREEVRTELERCQRDGGLRDRLTPLQRLREEINGQKPDEGGNARLHSVRNA